MCSHRAHTSLLVRIESWGELLQSLWPLYHRSLPEYQVCRTKKCTHDSGIMCRHCRAQQSKRDAHYHTAHLLAIMTKLMPDLAA